ncbi:hypothetical protein AB0F91_32785 [Amycolatopsis sp. NPDC023774]|uniref:hypothetical protein n=1 Tax=Amycolatopsis sp. NPDC023774 TaxID=3155015 RepID=UPI0033E5E3C7
MASMEKRGSQRRYPGCLRDALRPSDALSSMPRLPQERLSGSMLPEERLLSTGGSPP